ncbi:MAG: DUF1385 domain-containing protein [Defluviitaleaceae bacterium]|nr:DUF1385 domain-containing protein [Defluviitaleaceae bacterium]
MGKPKETPFFYGGQAVIEGVMMRGKDSYCVAVRNPQGEIESRMGVITTSGAAAALGKIPVVRGVVRMGSSMMTGMKVLKDSAEISGMETEENPSKFDMWLERKFGDNLVKYIMALSLVISLTISVLLFMALPTWLSGFLAPMLQGNLWALGIIEGIVRLCIFIVYLVLIAQMKDIKRVFMNHGAEHKVINCHEAGEELTVNNARLYSRLHRRCGTSFLLSVMIISMIFFLFVRTDVLWLRVASRILFVPFIAGISYEVIRWAGMSKSPIVRAVSFPGMMLQKITTAEPDDSQLETAIAALEGLMANEAANEIVEATDVADH